jgi:hypothetical protein
MDLIHSHFEQLISAETGSNGFAIKFDNRIKNEKINASIKYE